MNDNANPERTSASRALPFIFPDAGVVNPDYFAYEALSGVNPPIWDGTRISMVPNLSWGSRIGNAPQNIPFPGYLNVNKTNDFAISLTKVTGRHTIKGGFYRTHSYKAQQRQGWQGTITFGNDTANPLDSTFGYSPTPRSGVFSSYTQNSKYIEGNFVYTNLEGYVQDNWKVTDRLTLDFGVRLVHQAAAVRRAPAGVELPPRQVESRASAPYIYLAGCGNGVYPCSGSNRQAMDPRTGALLGPNTAAAIGTLVPNSGNTLNGLYVAGQGIAKTAHEWPTLAVGAPLRRRVRPDGPAEDHPARRRGPLLRSHERQRGHVDHPEPAGAPERHGPLRLPAGHGDAASRPRAPRRCPPTSTSRASRRPGRGTAASR